MNIAQMRLPQLRVAIQNNDVSFPAQVPIFVCQSRADIQWRLVQLYFIHNWSCPELGERYGFTMERVRQLISQWVHRAVGLGYLQEIPELHPAVPNPASEQPASLSTFVNGPPPLPEPGVQPAVLSRA